MKTLKLAVIALALVSIISCNKEQKEVETIVIDTIEKTTGKTEILAENLKTTTFSIEGMSCQINCAAKIEKSLNNMDGVGTAKVDFESKTATVSYDAGKVTTDLLAKRVASNGDYVAGFTKTCSAKCDTKCSADCKDANCIKCAAKKEACKIKCTAKKEVTSCAADCKKVCCAPLK